MNTQLYKKFATNEHIERNIANITKHMILGYLFFHYIDKNKWVNELQSCFGVEGIDNQTDFNYARGFCYCINEGGVDLRVSTKQFDEYMIENGVLNRVYIWISALAPFMAYRFMEYEYKAGSLSLKMNHEPAIEFRNFVEHGVERFCDKNKHFIISEENLSKVVKGISLELAGKNSSVFNLFFEDMYSQ